VIAHAPEVGDDELVNSTGRFLFCWNVVNPAIGVGHGTGVGDAVGDAEGDALGEVEPVGLGDGDGDALGAAEGTPVGGGTYTMSAVDSDRSVIVCPPMNGASSGVMRLNCPWTVTVTRFAGVAPFAHDGEQTFVTSAGVTVMNEFADSRVAAHITRLDAEQALPEENESG
jgi:hypothetical protein